MGDYFFGKWLESPPGREAMCAMVAPIFRIFDYEEACRSILKIRRLTSEEETRHKQEELQELLESLHEKAATTATE